MGQVPDVTARQRAPRTVQANFWEMGETGPCGPCSEIHFDRIGGRDASAMVNADDPTVIEIWNIVFMQFNREPDRSLRELPAKHIDTGMGFERLTSILQHAMSNYDTDIFAPLFDAIQRVTGAAPYTGKLGKDDPDNKDMAYRVLADHARTLTFAITDGAVPSNEGRGYVLRRILRRAVRYGQQTLKAKPGFFSQLVPVVVAHFKHAFPELEPKCDYVMSIVSEEESSFNRTLSNGIKNFNAFAKRTRDAGSATLPGADAFFLYDSMGFPLDLTQLMAAEEGMTVDVAGYDAAMAEQKLRSQQGSKFARDHDKLTLEAEQTAWLASHDVTHTADGDKYDWNVAPVATVKAVFTGSKTGFIEEATSDLKTVGIVLDATPFYAESGGQCADVGTLTLVTGAEATGASGGAGASSTGGAAAAAASTVVMDVADVQVFGGYVLHIGSLRKPTGEGAAASTLRVGARVRADVDYERRSLVAPNHTMTHVLNLALREVLGDGADQRGSTVAADKLRFDFASNKGLTADQLGRVEAIVNEQIDKAFPVHSAVVALKDALSIKTLRAVFGETYPDPVRVISVGVPVEELLRDPAATKWAGVSVELCGGTHIKNTSAAARFALTEEGSISKGVRRIVALTREAAVAAHNRAAELKTDVSIARSLSGAALEARAEEIRRAVDEAIIPQHEKMLLREALAELGKRVIAEAKAASAKAFEVGKTAALAAAAAAASAGARFVVVDLPIGGDGGLGRNISGAVKEAHGDLAFLALSSDGATKVTAFCHVPAPLIAAGLKAAEWLNATVAVGGGRCGGKDDSAQGNAKDIGKVAEMLAAANAFATANIK